MNDWKTSLTVREAFSVLRAHWPTPVVELVELDDCLGRILASDVSARVSVPPFDASAMDGYAVRLRDTKVGTSLQIVEEVPAGTIGTRSIGEGEAVRVYTGSMIPAGADHVLIQEHAISGDASLEICHEQTASRHIRRAGGDFKAGDTVLSRGQILTPSHLGVAAAANQPRVPVLKRLSIAIVTCGDELLPPGSEPEIGQIIQSNSFALSALLRSKGATIHSVAKARDDVAELKSKIEEAKDADLVLAVGGASTGKHDLVREAFSNLGGEMVFERLAVRPGKPTWMGLLDDQVFLGLPGNPTAAFVIASLFLGPLLRGAQQIEYEMAFLSEEIAANGDKETFTRARWEAMDGAIKVCSLRDQDTSRTKVLTSTNCLIRRLPNDKARAAGEKIEVFQLQNW